MPDNKIRISSDVLTKAEQIAAEWGLKNARAAVEAVFRRYCDDYLYGRASQGNAPPALIPNPPRQPLGLDASSPSIANGVASQGFSPPCEALDALDDLLAM
ncbi:MAG: hypothetical protein AAF152_18380 [Cyanobacteria bacterium P01_A01_bin.114]